MATLIAHHVQEYWNDGLEEFGTSSEDTVSKLVDFINSKEGEIDKVIVSMFEQFEPDYSHTLLIEFCEVKGIEIEFHEYGYGWYRDEDEHDQLIKLMDEGEHSFTAQELSTFVHEFKELSGTEIVDSISDELRVKVSEDLLHKIEGYKPIYESYPSDKEGVEWCFGARDHHGHEDVIEIPEWMVALRDEGVSVYVTGAFENECILDLQTALSELDIEYERVEGIIAGTHVDYEYFEEPQNELKSDLEFAFFDVQEFLYDGWSESSYDDLNKYIENLRLNDLNDIHEKINFITSEINSLRQDLDVDDSSEVFEYLEPLLTADEPDWYYDLKVKEAKKEVLSFSNKLSEIVKKEDTTKNPSKLSESSHLSIKSKSRTF